MKSRKSNYRQVPYHAHSTYIQTSNRAIKDQKPITKGTNKPETKKNDTKIEKFAQKHVQKGYMTPLDT